MLGVPAPKVAMTQADWRAADRLDGLDLISARPDAAAGPGAQPGDLGGTFNPFSSAGMSPASPLSVRGQAAVLIRLTVCRK